MRVATSLLVDLLYMRALAAWKEGTRRPGCQKGTWRPPSAGLARVLRPHAPGGHASASSASPPPRGTAPGREQVQHTGLQRRWEGHIASGERGGGPGAACTATRVSRLDAERGARSPGGGRTARCRRRESGATVGRPGAGGDAPRIKTGWARLQARLLSPTGRAPNVSDCMPAVREGIAEQFPRGRLGCGASTLASHFLGRRVAHARRHLTLTAAVAQLHCSAREVKRLLLTASGARRSCCSHAHCLPLWTTTRRGREDDQVFHDHQQPRCAPAPQRLLAAAASLARLR